MGGGGEKMGMNGLPYPGGSAFYIIRKYCQLRELQGSDRSSVRHSSSTRDFSRLYLTLFPRRLVAGRRKRIGVEINNFPNGCGAGWRSGASGGGRKGAGGWSGVGGGVSVLRLGHLVIRPTVEIGLACVPPLTRSSTAHFPPPSSQHHASRTKQRE